MLELLLIWIYDKFRPFHKTLPRSTEFVSLISVLCFMKRTVHIWNIWIYFHFLWTVLLSFNSCIPIHVKCRMLTVNWTFWIRLDLIVLMFHFFVNLPKSYKIHHCFKYKYPNFSFSCFCIRNKALKNRQICGNKGIYTYNILTEWKKEENKWKSYLKWQKKY